MDEAVAFAGWVSDGTDEQVAFFGWSAGGDLAQPSVGLRGNQVCSVGRFGSMSSSATAGMMSSTRNHRGKQAG